VRVRCCRNLCAAPHAVGVLGWSRCPIAPVDEQVYYTSFLRSLKAGRFELNDLSIPVLIGYYWVWKVWSACFGTSLFAARSLATVFSVLGVVGGAFLIRELGASRIRAMTVSCLVLGIPAVALTGFFTTDGPVFVGTIWAWYFFINGARRSRPAFSLVGFSWQASDCVGRGYCPHLKYTYALVSHDPLYYSADKILRDFHNFSLAQQGGVTLGKVFNLLEGFRGALVVAAGPALLLGILTFRSCAKLEHRLVPGVVELAGLGGLQRLQRPVGQVSFRHVVEIPDFWQPASNKTCALRCCQMKRNDMSRDK
jgi:hypothetical protein